jgi:3-dehydroquinate synthase II
MKRIWVNCSPWNKDIAIAALESAVDAILVPDGMKKKVKELGLIKTIAGDGDLKLGEEVVCLEIKDKSDEKRALELAKYKTLILRMANWKIIPLENLIAQTERIFVEVADAREAETALGILEKGVSGVFLKTDDLSEVRKTVSVVKSTSQQLKLEIAKIEKVAVVGSGDRVCIDTCTNMSTGEGMLIGNSSGAMFLVHSESVENPYVTPRPFRVNAGPVHAYTLLPEGKTKYLSELGSGDKVLVVDYKGKTQVAVIGRIKIEKRPLILIEGKTEKKKVSAILQNAETVRLVSPIGEPLSVVELQRGSEVLSYFEETGRHFGIKIEETITER